MLFYSARFYYGCGLGPNGLSVYNERGRRKVTGLPLGGDTLHLKIINDDQTVGLYWSPDGTTWTRVEDARDVSPYQTNLLRGFRSLRIALFACGGGAAETEFRNFVYSPWPVEK
jgi:beta-xylosidase